MLGFASGNGVGLLAFGHLKPAIAVRVAHLPPGTSKWNRIDHRLFSNISQNGAASRSYSRQFIVQLIGATTTDTGLTVTCDIDAGCYPRGIKVSDAEMDGINIEHHAFTASRTTP